MGLVDCSRLIMLHVIMTTHDGALSSLFISEFFFGRKKTNRVGTGATAHRCTGGRQDGIGVASSLGKNNGRRYAWTLYLNVTIGVPQRPFGRLMSEFLRGGAMRPRCEALSPTLKTILRVARLSDSDCKLDVAHEWENPSVR